MTARQQTITGLYVCMGTLLIIESNALFNKESSDTISAISARTIRHWPVVAGLLAGTIAHFITPTTKLGEKLPWWRGVTVAVISGFILGLTWPRPDPGN